MTAPEDGLRKALELIRDVCDAPIDAFGGSHRIRMVVVPAIVADLLTGESEHITAIRIGLDDALRSTPAAPQPECLCLDEPGIHVTSRDCPVHAPQPDPIPDHYPHSDGYQRDCRRCVIDAATQSETQHAAGCCGDPEPHRAPQPDTALTVERLARALHFHDFGKYPSIVPCGHIGDAAAILRALVGEGVER